MKFFTKEVKIALVAILGVVVFFYGVNFLKGLTIFSTATTYYMTFDNLEGLGASTPVYADGYKVGVVKSIDYDYSRKNSTRVAVGINQDMRIPKGSTAEIVKDLMGNIQVNILLANNPRERVEPGGVIPGGVNPGALGAVKGMVPEIEKMLPKLDSILASLNTLLANPAIAQSLSNIQTTTANLAVSTQQLNKLMGSLNREVPGMLRKANGVLDNTNRLTNNLAAVDVQETMSQVNRTLANMEAFTDKLNSNKGTLGLLMNDPELYDNLNATMRNADSLMINFKAHPKRYVHFSLFGRKDK